MPSMPDLNEAQREALARAIQAIADAGSLLFITGAGISADSGLPTYRGIGGLYNDEGTEDGVRIEDALSGPMFARDPAVTWKYIRQIEAACRGAKPNAAHHRIAQLERGDKRVWVLTQNVDGLHASAGSEQLIAIHGDVHAMMCTACDWRARVNDYAAFDATLECPTCPACEAVIRPRVVLFEEALPSDAVQVYERELSRGFDLIVAVGTSAGFPYIAGPVVQAVRAGIPTIEINPGRTPLSSLVDTQLKLGAAAALEAIAAGLGLEPV